MSFSAAKHGFAALNLALFLNLNFKPMQESS